MSTADLRSLWANDVVKIVGTLFALYAAYLVMGMLSGIPLRGILATIVQLTLLITIYAMLSLALNLHWGYTGLFNIGIVGFMAIGAYVFLILAKPPAGDSAAALFGGFGLPFIVAVLGGVIAAAILGLLVALPALRLRADYLAIVTIAMSEIVRFIFMSATFQKFSLFGYDLGTGGGRGLLVNFDDPIEKFILSTDGYGGVVEFINTLFGIEGTLAPVVDTFVIASILMIVVVGYYWLFKRTGESPFGRVLKAIREDEDVARALGKNTGNFKIKSFMLGCALMGLAGVFYAMYFLGSVNPTAFKPQLTFFVWVALIIGGTGSNTGAVLGSSIFVGVLFLGPLYMKNVITNLFKVGTFQGTFVDALGALLSLDVVPVVAYTFDNISHFRIIALGVVLIWLMKRRPQGLMGDRQETAASIPLVKPARPAAADGGDGE